MSDLLDLVKSSYYHNVLGYHDAEARLEGREGSYLFRESDVKKGMFIISYVRNSSVAHILTPTKNGKYIRQSLEEAVDIAADVIASSDSYQNPVPPPGCQETSDSDSDDNNNDDNQGRCYCCGYSNTDHVKLHSHQKSHKIVKCQKCFKYFKSSTFFTHKKHCNTTPEKLSCGVCGYETIHPQYMGVHRKNHILRPYLCRQRDCRRCFKTEEDLKHHQELHLASGEGHKCEHCGKTFRHRYEMVSHKQRVHIYSKRRTSCGWFLMVNEIQNQKRGLSKGRQMIFCEKDGCDFKTRASCTGRMERHQASKHPDTPRPKKPYQCSACSKKFAFPYLLHKHERACKLVKSKSKRIVKMVTNQSLISIKKKYACIPNKTFCNLFRDFSKANPDVIFEGNLAQALQESINELKKHFSADYLNVVDKNGLDVATVIVLVKDLHYIIREYVKRKGVKNVRVAIGQDGGNQNKYLVCLAIYDMDRLGLDICGYSSGGRRRTLVIAAVNRCKELRPNLDKVLSGLYLVKLEYRTICPCDLKAANLLMGIGPHTSLYPCIYCEASKIDDKTRRPTNKAGQWSQGARRRTIRVIQELRRLFLEKWRGRKGGIDSARAKADIKNFFSVVGLPIELPEAMLDRLVLLIIPPDPLHVTLLGGFKNMKSFIKSNIQFPIGIISIN